MSLQRLVEKEEILGRHGGLTVTVIGEVNKAETYNPIPERGSIVHERLPAILLKTTSCWSADGNVS